MDQHASDKHVTSKQRIVSPKVLIIGAMASYSVWLLGFLFDTSLFSLVTKQAQTNHVFIISVVSHVLGYAYFGYRVTHLESAKRYVKFGLVGIIAILGLMVHIPSAFALGLFAIGAFFGSGILVSFAYLIKAAIPKAERAVAMGVVLIFTNLGLFVLDELMLLNRARVATVFVMLMLIISLVLSLFLQHLSDIEIDAPSYQNPMFLRKDLWLLGLMIAIITINGGLMYKVIVPSYTSLGNIVSHLWLWPYMLGIILYLILCKFASRGSILIGFTALLGFSFVVYLVGSITMPSFLMVFLFLMVPLGAFDSYWWGTLTELFDETQRPGSVFAFGMVANVVGVLIGMLISEFLAPLPNQGTLVVAIALTSVFVVLGVFPLLNHLLYDKDLLEIDVVSLFDFASHENKIKLVVQQLSERELQITKGLLEGKTYKMIAADLHLSVNTIKFHIRTIYKKFEVKSRFELKQLFEKGSQK